MMPHSQFHAAPCLPMLVHAQPTAGSALSDSYELQSEFPVSPLIMETQLEKKMGNHMETGIF